MTFYKNHMFICTNQKSNNKQCCADNNACEMVEYAKQKAKDLGLTKESKFRVSSSGCMGRCAEGPVLAVYPSGNWYTYQNRDDIDKILKSIVSGSSDDLDSLLI